MSSRVNFWQGINAHTKCTNVWFLNPEGEGEKKKKTTENILEKWRDKIQLQTKNTHSLSLSRRRWGKGHELCSPADALPRSMSGEPEGVVLRFLL